MLKRVSLGMFPPIIDSWVMLVSFAAPCWCLKFAGMKTRVPGVSLISLSSEAITPVPEIINAYWS